MGVFILGFFFFFFFFFFLLSTYLCQPPEIVGFFCYNFINFPITLQERTRLSQG